MLNLSTSFWWPLELSLSEEEAINNFRDRMIETPASLDTSLVDSISNQLAQLMHQHIGEIIDRDSLPHLGHILNGWGNVRFNNLRLTERLDSFIHRDGSGGYFVLQCDPEGEFHPWQSFAYAIMAGLDPDEMILSGVTMRELAQNSRYINTREGRELGHLLFALAYLDPNINGRAFSLQGDICSVDRLMQMAVEAHHNGSFDVCRKFHLTEGLCAMAAKVEGLENYREAARGFLQGQLNMLLVLGAILDEAKELIAEKKQPAPDSLIRNLRDTLVMDDYLENHCYYAGHIIELATFADCLGYDIAPEHRSAMAFVVNEINRALPNYLPEAAFADCFLHLGHYRRAITLLAEIEGVQRDGFSAKRSDPARFTVDFDTLAFVDRLQVSTPSWSYPMIPGVYQLAEASENPRPEFVSIVTSYSSIAPPHFNARGKADHFRRIGPPWWPRAIHYELLDYGGNVGVEIHLESDDVQSLGEPLSSLTEQVAARFPAQRVRWDPKWSGGRGRLSVLFGTDTPPETIANAMTILIDETFEKLDAAVRSYQHNR